MVPSSRYSLRELWEASGRPVPVTKAGDDGQALYEWNLRFPDKSQSVIIAISPSRHFAMAAIKLLDIKGKPVEFFGDLRVVEFQEPKPRIFLPKVIRGESSGADRPETVVRDPGE